MGIVTGEAGESPVAIAKTGGAMQKPGLVANIPDVGPIGIVVQIAGLTVAGATQCADLKGREPAGILNRLLPGRFGVRTAGPVAGFAVNARFAWLNLEAVG